MTDNGSSWNRVIAERQRIRLEVVRALGPHCDALSDDSMLERFSHAEDYILGEVLVCTTAASHYDG